MFLVQKEILRGVSVWNVRETGGQESHCPGHENVTFVEIWSFLAWTSVVKRLFLLIKSLNYALTIRGSIKFVVLTISRCFVLFRSSYG